MTDKDLLNVLENGGKIAVPYFSGTMVQIDRCDLSPQEALPALKNFLTLSPEKRMADARHLLAYCKMMVDAVGQEILEDMGGLEPILETIWNYVRVNQLFFGKLGAGKYAATPTVFVQLEGDVAWEIEHCLQMSWAEGKRLVKVGAFDGHPTNGHASANPADDQYVFVCYKPELCTLPDPV